MILNENILSLISDRVEVPDYDRKSINTGIVHIGVGNFHRAHEAYYTDLVLKTNTKFWGICGVGLLENDHKMYEVMKQQNNLYALVEMGSGDTSVTRIIGSIVDYLFAPDDPGEVLPHLVGVLSPVAEEPDHAGYANAAGQEPRQRRTRARKGLVEFRPRVRGVAEMLLCSLAGRADLEHVQLGLFLRVRQFQERIHRPRFVAFKAEMNDTHRSVLRFQVGHFPFPEHPLKREHLAVG